MGKTYAGTGAATEVIDLLAPLPAHTGNADTPGRTPREADLLTTFQPGDVTPVSRFQAVANTAPGRVALGPIA